MVSSIVTSMCHPGLEILTKLYSSKVPLRDGSTLIGIIYLTLKFSQYFKIKGDRSRRTWITRLDLTDLDLAELVGQQEIPVVELWHWRGHGEVWQDISRSLATQQLRPEKLVLNDVGLTDQFVPQIIETLVSVRYPLSILYHHL